MAAETRTPPIRFGIIGCADIARKVSRAISLAPNAVISAVASRSIEKASLFAKANKFPPEAKIYGSYEALLDDPDIDAVYLPLPTSLHVKWAVVVAQKKKHLLMEKPVALNVAEFDVIAKACEENGVQFMDGTMWVHNLRTAKMREFLSDSERFGQLRAGGHSTTLNYCIMRTPCNQWEKLNGQPVYMLTLYCCRHDLVRANPG